MSPGVLLRFGYAARDFIRGDGDHTVFGLEAVEDCSHAIRGRDVELNKRMRVWIRLLSRE